MGDESKGGCVCTGQGGEKGGGEADINPGKNRGEAKGAGGTIGLGQWCVCIAWGGGGGGERGSVGGVFVGGWGREMGVSLLNWGGGGGKPAQRERYGGRVWNGRVGCVVKFWCLVGVVGGLSGKPEVKVGGGAAVVLDGKKDVGGGKGEGVFGGVCVCGGVWGWGGVEGGHPKTAGERKGPPKGREDRMIPAWYGGRRRQKTGSTKRKEGVYGDRRKESGGTARQRKRVFAQGERPGKKNQERRGGRKLEIAQMEERKGGRETLRNVAGWFSRVVQVDQKKGGTSFLTSGLSSVVANANGTATRAEKRVQIKREKERIVGVCCGLSKGPSRSTWPRWVSGELPGIIVFDAGPPRGRKKTGQGEKAIQCSINQREGGHMGVAKPESHLGVGKRRGVAPQDEGKRKKERRDYLPVAETKKKV